MHGPVEGWRDYSSGLLGKRGMGNGILARGMLIGLVLASVLLAAVAQLTLKVGMSREVVQRALDEQSHFRTVAVIATSPWIIGGLICFGLSAIVWLLVLARLDLSTAYPFFSLGFVITAALGYFIFGEPMPATKLAGVAAIVCGVLLISLSVPSRAEPHRASGALEPARGS